MSKYNLLQYSSIITNTSSGTGNVELTTTDIIALYDGTTTSGIPMSFADTLYLDIDLGNRTKLDSIFLYISSAESPSHVISDKLDIYYKNELEDDYTLGTISYTDKYELVSYVSPLTPRYVRVVLTGLVGTLDEITIYNDDSDVAFGSDGTVESMYLNNEAGYIELPIFNNAPIGSRPANAFTSVDYSTNYDYNEYIRLSSSIAGEYKSVSEGISIKDNDPDSYGWRAGTFNSTFVDPATGYVTTLNNGADGLDTTALHPDGLVLSNNNKTVTLPEEHAHWLGTKSTVKIPIFSGRWYWEFTADNADNRSILYGLTRSELDIRSGYSSYYTNGNTFSVYTGDVVGIAFDSDTGNMWFAINGSWYGNPVTNNQPYHTGITADAIANNDHYICAQVALQYANQQVTLRMSESDINPAYIPESFKPALSVISSEANYTTPILSFNNKSLANQVYFDYITTSGTYISKDKNINSGLVEVRSSNTPPEVYQDLFIPIRYNYYYADYLFRCRVNTSTDFINVSYVQGNNNFVACSFFANKKFGYIAYITCTSSTTRIWFYDITDNTPTQIAYYASASKNLIFDYDAQNTGTGSIWGYGSHHGILAHYSANLTTALYVDNRATHFISGLASALTGDSVWYVDRETKSLIHLEAGGGTTTSTDLINPKDVAATSSDGCWANDGKVVTNYDYFGNVLQSVIMPANVHIMCHDWDDGFWCICTNGVLYNVDSGGSILSSNYTGYTPEDTKSWTPYSGPSITTRVMILRPSSDRVYVYKQYANTVESFFKVPGTLPVSYTLPQPTGTYAAYYYNIMPDVFYLDGDNYASVDYGEIFATDSTVTTLFPPPSDPIWGTDGSLEWKTMGRDNNFLSKESFQQIKVSFSLDEGEEDKPYLKGIYIPPAIELQDIAPQSSKSIYIKSNFTESTTMFDYDIKLKTWWGV